MIIMIWSLLWWLSSMIHHDFMITLHSSWHYQHPDGPLTHYQHHHDPHIHHQQHDDLHHLHHDPHLHHPQTEARILEKHLMETSSLSVAIQVPWWWWWRWWLWWWWWWWWRRGGWYWCFLFRIPQLFPGTVEVQPQIQLWGRKEKMAFSSVNSSLIYLFLKN